MTRDTKRRPAYAVTSVDHALRIATTLRLDGGLTVGRAVRGPGGEALA